MSRKQNFTDQIPTIEIIELMVSGAKGETEMTATQAKLCDALLSRTLPTLKAVESNVELSAPNVVLGNFLPPADE